MTEALVGFAWLANVDSPAKRALLGTLALHAGPDGAGWISMDALAGGAAMSCRSSQTHLRELAAAGWLTRTRQRSLVSGRYRPTEFVLAGPFSDPNNLMPSANMSSSELPMAAIGRFSSIRFDPDRVNPAWAWRVGVPTAAHRVVLATVALLSDHRGVCLAPRATIADRSLVSLASANRVLNDLEQAGWIGREARRRGARAAEARLHLTRRFLETAAPAGDGEPPVPADPSGGPVQEALVAAGGLPGLVCAARAAGWQGPAADELAAALADVIGGEGKWVALRRVDFRRQDAIADTISLAWMALIEHADQIMTASNPWGFLLSIVARQAAKQDQRDRGIVVTGKAKSTHFR